MKYVCVKISVGLTVGLLLLCSFYGSSTLIFRKQIAYRRGVGIFAKSIFTTFLKQTIFFFFFKQKKIISSLIIYTKYVLRLIR